MITHLKFVSVPTRDQDAALRFWTEQVGFAVLSDQPFGEAQRWIELSIRDSDTRLVLFTPDGHEERIGGFFNGAFACDDVEATFRQLSARGVEFDGPPQKQQWGTFATFHDPDGNRFVLSSR
jgi:predicted enzyme related to lactoylglutathione lyase